MKKQLFVFLLILNFHTNSLVFNQEMRQRLTLGFVIGAVTNLFSENFLSANLWGISVNQLTAYLGYTIPFYEIIHHEMKAIKISDMYQRSRIEQEYFQRKKHYTIRAYGSNFLGYLLGAAFAYKIKDFSDQYLSRKNKNT